MCSEKPEPNLRRAMQVDPQLKVKDLEVEVPYTHSATYLLVLGDRV